MTECSKHTVNKTIRKRRTRQASVNSVTRDTNSMITTWLLWERNRNAKAYGLINTSQLGILSLVVPDDLPNRIHDSEPLKQYTFSTNGFVLEIFENFLIGNFWPRTWIQHPKSSRTTNSHIPRVCDLDFMAILNLRIYKGLDHENRSECNFTPSVIIHDQIPYEFSNLSSS